MPRRGQISKTPAGEYACLYERIYGRKKAGNFTEINKLGRRRKNKKIPPIFRLNSNHPLNFLENLV